MKIKNILILYKTSVYEHSIAGRPGLAKLKLMRRGLMKRFIGTHNEHYRTLKKLEEFLRTEGVRYSRAVRGSRVDFSPYGLIITVGGDGTFLEAAARVKGQLMLGINSDPQWSVGRFCYANAKNFRSILRRVLRGKAEVRSFNRMQIELKNTGRRMAVLNDILVCHANPAAMSRYYLQFKGQKEEQRSSGVWVATAAGSTGAIRSAKGRVLPEESRSLQFVVRELYCGKLGKPKKHSAVFSAKDHLKIVSLMKDGVIFVDGSHVSVPFPFGEEITIRNSPYPLKVVTG